MAQNHAFSRHARGIFYEDLLYNKVKDYLAIRKGDLKDSAFEKFHQSLVVDFINWQPGLDKEQAENFSPRLQLMPSLLPLMEQKKTRSWKGG